MDTIVQNAPFLRQPVLGPLLLDMDERLLELAALIDIVYSPLVDHKIFPEQVDLTLVEGSVSSEDDLAKIKKIRALTPACW